MKLGYEKLLEKQDLDANDLSNDVQLRIREITQLKNLILSKKRIGQNVSDITLEKLKEKDAELCDIILEDIEDLDLDDDNDSDENQDENFENENFGDQETGILIDEELKMFSGTGQSTITLNNMKSIMPNVYDVIWESYEDNNDNGISTSNFDLIETGKNSETFKLIKK